MANTCTLPLFSKDFDLSFIRETIKNSTIENVGENVASLLKKQTSFATSQDKVEDQDSYEDNIIEELIPSIIDEIQGTWKVMLTAKTQKDIVNTLKNSFITTKEEEKKDDNVITTETVEDKNNNKQSYSVKQLYTILFKNEPLLSHQHNREFTKNLSKIIIFNDVKNQRNIVYNQENLNNNIKQYKQNLYEIIYQFCINNNIPVSKVRTYYDKNYIVKEKAEENLNQFLLYIRSMDPDTRNQQLEKAYEDKVHGNKDISILDAINSYITLIKFDELLKQTVGKYISINKSLNEPINIVINNGRPQIKYKYSFGIKQNNMSKDFRDIMQSALDTMGNFSKFLIESIPRINSDENITQIQYINSLIHLKQAIQNLEDIDFNIQKFKNPFYSLHEDPIENWRIILNNFSNLGSYDRFIKAGLTFEDIEIINSIQRFIYGKSAKEKENSLYELEKNFHDEIGHVELYPLIETLLGAIDSISDLSYLETKWDNQNKILVTGIKRKYFNSKQRFDLIQTVNLESRKELSESEKNDYKINYLNGPFNFTILGLNINVSQTKSSEYGIFDNNIEVKIDDESIDSYFKNIDLNGTSTRINLLKSEDIFKRQFIELLRFIDKALGTSLSINSEGLQRFHIYKLKHKNALKDLVVAAARVYIVKDLNSKFQKSIKSNEINPNTKEIYTELDFRDWLKFHHLSVPIIQFTKDENKWNKKYFVNYGGITYLNPIQFDESWIDDLADAQTILLGESLRAVTRDFNRNNIPNYSPAYLGAEVKELLYNQSKNSTTKSLLFSTKINAIKHIVIDTDVKTQTGGHKSVSDMTEAELQYHFFVNKFLVPFKNNIFYSQPTVYSDKKKFINYEISLLDLDVDFKNDDEILETILKTLGDYYKNIYNEILEDYRKLFGITTVKEINEKLHELTLSQLLRIVDEYNENNNDKIELLENLHYRLINGRLGLNEILFYNANFVFNNLSNLKYFINIEKINYVNTLLKSGVIFNFSSEYKIILNKVAKQLGISLHGWLSGDNLILAKIHNEDGTITDVIAGENNIDPSLNIEVNPLLSKYVLLHNLINNNLKESLLGTEAIHKVKIGPPKITNAIKTLDLENPDLVDLQIKLLQLQSFPYPSPEDLDYLTEVENDILSQVKNIQSEAQIAQLKRTVAIPGTMRYYLQGSIKGITKTLRCAIIQDVQASVFNYDGISKHNLDAHDGGSFLNPITALLQNYSLQDSEVGDVIKPLWQAELNKYGCKKLVKYAAEAMTNSKMRNSVLSEISMYNMFKKMTNIRWKGMYNSHEKNLLNQYNHRSDNRNVRFSDITEISGKLYFTLNDKTYNIINFGYDSKGYFTEEQEVMINPSNKKVTTIYGSEPVKYYHYFDDSGKHIKLREDEAIPVNTHTIDSIYELHATFGGIYSQEFSDGKFIDSENSIVATTAIINMVSEPTEKYKQAKINKTEILNTQEYFYQPLKHMMVDYLINQSAIKNGASNINFSSVYENPENELNDINSEEPLRYVELDTFRYGIQQDSEHETDDEELTEMTQVISAIDAGGYYHKEVKELYEAIGYLALTSAKVELSAIESFKNNPKNLNVLYDLVGRTLIQHLTYNRGQNGLAESLIETIKRTFSLNSEHDEDLIKIPFSDQVIYSRIISTISSILNKKSIKRKFPGTGQVMVPGYNIVQIWDIDGFTVKYDDLIKIAKEDKDVINKINPTLDVHEYNKSLVKTYLQKKQKEFEINNTINLDLLNRDSWENSLQNINPIDIVQITINGNPIKPIKLDKIEDYYLFKNDLLQFIKEKFLINENDINELQVVKRIDIPRNLAPLKLIFTYVDSNGIEHTKNIYDHWAVKNMYFGIKSFKENLKVQPIPKEQQNILLEQEKIRLRNIEQEQLNNLDRGNYIDENGNKFKIISQESTPAETLMSNIYKSKFNIKRGESLYDILKEGPKRFMINPLRLLPKENIYDLAFMKTNGEGILISFDDNEITGMSGQYRVKNNNFYNISKHYVINKDDKYYDGTTGELLDETSITKRTKTINGKNIISYIYLLDDNNIEIMPIGIEIDVSDEVEFDGKNYVYKNNKKVIKEREFSIKDGKVIEQIQFVEKKTIQPKFREKYSIYNIKNNLLESLLGSSKEIVSKLYNQDSYSYILPAKFINPNNIKVIYKSLYYLNQQSSDEAVKNLLNGLMGGISQAEKQSDKFNNGEVLIGLKNYSGYYKEYNKILANNIFNSFKESLNFISSRIPAQSLQSFMKMINVGFTQSNANQAYVSHWQTWLQGSDYDIDKSYMLGNDFDNNGLYQGWSPLFDYSMLNESKKLPFATGIIPYTNSKDKSGVNIDVFIDMYNQASTKQEKLSVINSLIRFINDNADSKKVQIAWENDDKQSARSKLINIVKKHNTYSPGLNKLQAGLKNFVSNKLQLIIQGTKNLIGSHSPITLDDIHSAADSSQNIQEKWIVMNPGYIPLMQKQAMVGKKGVGIAANGQKGSFIWKYWMTDSINENNEYKKYVDFPVGFYIDRIEGRFNGDIKKIDIKRLPDVNMYNASDDDKLFYEYNENHYIPSDQMLSQMISAATDNAKELILDKINANTDLSKVYMYLITLGFDVKDIVNFMTSEAIDFIAKNSIDNIFLNYKYRVQDVAIFIENVINVKLNPQYKQINTPSIRQYSSLLYQKAYALIDSKDSEQLNEMLKDLQEFRKIYELSEEFSNLGRMLGMNQGVPTTKEDLMGFKKFIFNIMNVREKAIGLIRQKNNKIEPNEELIKSLIPENLQYLVNNFDVDKYLDDKNYRNDVIEYYNLIKGSVNIFALVESTPQFQAIINILNIVNIIDSNTIAKSKAVNYVFKEILKQFPYASTDYSMQILPILNTVLIEDYFESNPLEIPVLEGWNYIGNKFDLQEYAENGTLIIGSLNSNLNLNAQFTSFHYLMDKYIIPQLKNGELKIDGKTIDLKSNAFIQNLVPTIDGNTLKYKLNLDMRAINNNPESKIILRNILKGMQELKNYTFGNTNLLNIFMAYSLIVDKNQTGSDKMTDLFATFVNEYQLKDNLMIDYFKHIGNIDFNSNDFIKRIKNYSVNDFLVALALPVSNKQGHNEPTIKYFNKDGTLSYAYNIGYNKYVDFGDLLPLKFGETSQERLLRQIRREQYGFGFIYSDTIMNIITNLRNFDKSDVWIETMSQVLSNGYLKLNIKCN